MSTVQVRDVNNRGDWQVLRSLTTQGEKLLQNLAVIAQKIWYLLPDSKGVQSGGGVLARSLVIA